MIPALSKMTEDIQKIILSPRDEAKKLILKEGTKAAAGGINKLIIPVHQRISKWKQEQSVLIHSDDIATAAALADILYSDTLMIKINGTSLSKKDGDMKSFPLSYLHYESLMKSEQSLHETADRLRKIRAIFDVGLPGCISVLLFSKYLDLKSLANKIISTQFLDFMMVKDALDNCKNGVEICDKGLSWANQHDALVHEWIDAHKKSSKQGKCR
ncbi:hypothetical protein [Azospirillum rugosum]|uniref:Uncharacterized protein n=1 Tax=Azospirillum rugosum TaxID=416170 RepID=A0ABS4SKY6_9PROT|nr:hypothetical protein [Azospirillum rugosum]MBP2293211.1 hypothetical protein [Azospirillum rugosum]